MIPKIIHQVWIGDQPPSPFLDSCVESIRRLHPAWEYRLHQDFSLMDDPRLDENLNGERVRHFFHSVLGKLKDGPVHKKLAMQADLLRLVILYLEGGFYIDMDMYGIQPLDPLCQQALVLMRLSKAIVGEGLIAAPPSSKAIAMLTRHYMQRKPEDGYISMDIHNAAKRHGWKAFDTEFFCPHTRYRDDIKYRHTDNTYTIHCWRQIEYDLNRLEAIGTELRKRKAING